ncbi:MAG: minor capsid protein [Synechococcus sp.]
MSRQNRVLGASAERLVGELSDIYGKIQTRGTGNFEAQQVNARLKNLGDLLKPQERADLVAQMKGDLAAAEATGKDGAKELSKLLGATGDTLKQNAKPNLPAIDNAGKRLNDFWAKENTLFRDRVTAMTQAAAAEGKSWRKLAADVRRLLLLEQKAGTESKRSQRVNARLGITTRAELIARTEMQTAYVNGQIAQYRALGYEWVRWSATAERSCPFCISRDGLLYEIGDADGAIPAHPRCRCSLIPADPPPNFKGKGKEAKGVEAAESLDDAYWTRSRAKKIQDFRKNNPQFTDNELRRYVRTPTNSQAYLRPGTPAPEPVWAPSGTLSPNLEAVVIAANQAAQNAKANDLKAKELAEKEKKAKEAERLAAKQEKELAEFKAKQAAAIEKDLAEFKKGVDGLPVSAQVKAQAMASATKKVAQGKSVKQAVQEVSVDLLAQLPGSISGAKAAATPAAKPFNNPKGYNLKQPSKLTKAQLVELGEANGLKLNPKGLKATMLKAINPLLPRVSGPTAPTTARRISKPKADGFNKDGSLNLEGVTYQPGATLAGSTKPQLFTSSSGSVVVKSGGAKGQNTAEHAAQAVYKTLDPNNSMKSRLIKDKLVNEFLTDAKTLGQVGATQIAKHQVYKHLRTNTAADALLANWDVMGLANDNIMLTTGGRVVKIDAGGTFNFRAQGAQKAYGSVPLELHSLRTGGGQLMNAWAGATESSYRDLYLNGMGRIRSQSTGLRMDVKNLSPTTRQAFNDRVDVFSQLHKIASGEVLVGNGQTVQSLIDGKKLTWEKFDKAVGIALKKLPATGSAYKGMDTPKFRQAVIDEVKVALDDILPKSAKKPVAKQTQKQKLLEEAQALGIQGADVMTAKQLQQVIGLKKTAPSAQVSAKAAADFELVSKQLGLSKDQWEKKSPAAKDLALKSAKKKAEKARAKAAGEAGVKGFKVPTTLEEYIKVPEATIKKMNAKQLGAMDKKAVDLASDGLLSGQQMKDLINKHGQVATATTQWNKAQQAKTGPITPEPSGGKAQGYPTDVAQQDAYMRKWLPGTKYKQWKDGTGPGYLPQLAQNAEGAFLDGQKTAGFLLKENTTQLKKIAKALSIKLPPEAKKFDVYKQLMMAEGGSGSAVPGSVSEWFKQQYPSTWNLQSSEGGKAPGASQFTKGTLKPFNPATASLAEMEAARGTSNHDNSVWGQTRYDGYRSKRSEKWIINGVADHLKAAGFDGSVQAAEKAIDGLVKYTGGDYRQQKASRLKVNRPDIYEMLPSSHKYGDDAPDLKERARTTAELIDSLPFWRGGEVRRGMKFDTPTKRNKFLKAYANGEGIGSMDSYSSNNDTAKGFDSGSHGLIMHLEDPKKAVTVKGMSQYDGENEVLLGEKTRFRIKKISFREDGSEPLTIQQVKGESFEGSELHVWLEEY